MKLFACNIQDLEALCAGEMTEQEYAEKHTIEVELDISDADVESAIASLDAE